MDFFLGNKVAFLVVKSSKLTTDELTSLPVWIKFHSVPVLAFTVDDLSTIATRLGIPVMLDSCTATTCNHNLPKQQMEYKKKKTSILVSNSFSALEEANEKPTDDLTDDTRKKMEAPPKKAPRKTDIWSSRKTDYPKRNVVFSPKMNVHYFDRDDMDFDDMGWVAKELEHRNVYSKNG
nr:hypothetical protein [Tanacetum cinerariifolium]